MKLSTFSKPFPAREAPYVDLKTGALAAEPYDYQRSIFNRTGGQDGIIPSIGTPLTAKGVNFLTALALVDDWNEILTVPLNTGVSIPALQVGQQIMIFNGGANALRVYPQPTTTIDALALGAFYSLATGKTQIFSFWALARIRSLQLG